MRFDSVLYDEVNLLKIITMIYEEDIEKGEKEYEDELSNGRKVARKRGVSLTKFKIDIMKGLTTKNCEDQWTFDYESYLLTIARGKFQTPIDWGEGYYFERWSL